MSGPLRIVALLLVALSALALAACGGGNEREENNAYVREVNAAQNEFAATVQTVSQRITDKSSSSQDRKTLQQFQSAIDDVVKQLGAINVPDGVTAEHRQLVTAMSGFGGQIESANAALRNPTTRNIADARNTIATATQTVNARIEAAIAAINSKIRDK